MLRAPASSWMPQPCELGAGCSWPMVSMAGRRTPAWSLLQGCIIEQLLDQVHVGQQHPAAAVALQAQGVQRIPLLPSIRERLLLQGATSPISQAN